MISLILLCLFEKRPQMSEIWRHGAHAMVLAGDSSLPAKMRMALAIANRPNLADQPHAIDWQVSVTAKSNNLALGGHSYPIEDRM